MVILEIVLVLVLGIFVESRIRRSRTHSLARMRRSRVAANDALRSRLERKVGAGVEKPKQKLERSC
jgi:hypothetical protein